MTTRPRRHLLRLMSSTSCYTNVAMLRTSPESALRVVPVMRQHIRRRLPLLLAATILGSQLFVPPFVGLADNGDFINITAPFQLVPDLADGSDRYFSHVIPTWQYIPDSPLHCRLLSSALLLLLPTIAVSRLTSHGEYDIRWCGLSFSLLFLMALWIVCPLIDQPWWLGWVVLFVLCDVTYFSWFNSFYMDAASFSLLALVVGCYLRLHDGAAFSVGFCIALILFLSSKLQHAYLSLIMVPFLYIDPRLTRYTSHVARLLTALAVSGLFVIMLRHVPDDYYGFASYNLVFSHILPTSPEPRQVLQELQLPLQCERFIGTSAFHERSGLRDAGLRPILLKRVTHHAVLQYYAHHPKTALVLLINAFRDSSRERPPGIGNFTNDSTHRKGALSNSFAVWSRFKSSLGSTSPLVYAISCMCVIVIGVVVGITSQHGAALGVCALALLAIVEFLIGALADCAETTRHLFLFRTLIDFLLLIEIAVLNQRIRPTRIKEMLAN